MNCIIVDDDIITRNILEILVRESAFLNFSGSCKDAAQAISFLSNKKQDLIFLDVEMHDMTGFEFLKKLGNEAPIVIMITAHKKYAADAFEFDVADFLVKPITPARFNKAVEKARKFFEMQNNGKPASELLLIKTSDGLVKLHPNEILFIKSLADYITIYTESNKFTTHSTLKGIYKNLPEGDFVRVHHSYIARLDKISLIESNFATVGNFRVPVSRAKRHILSERFSAP